MKTKLYYVLNKQGNIKQASMNYLAIYREYFRKSIASMIVSAFSNIINESDKNIRAVAAHPAIVKLSEQTIKSTLEDADEISIEIKDFKEPLNKIFIDMYMNALNAFYDASGETKTEADIKREALKQNPMFNDMSLYVKEFIKTDLINFIKQASKKDWTEVDAEEDEYDE